MKCPECKSENLGVAGSVKTFVTINHRYLRCFDCGTIFQTKEIIIKESIASQFYLEFETPEDKPVEETKKKEKK